MVVVVVGVVVFLGSPKTIIMLIEVLKEKNVLLPVPVIIMTKESIKLL